MHRQNYLIKIILSFVLFISSEAYCQSEGDWVYKNYNTGQYPECIKCIPKYDFTLDNFLRVSISDNTDVIIKLHNYNNDECIRCVYIKAGSKYDIKNIPQGIYKIKIAYGKNWAVKMEKNYLCEGKFLENAYYKEGENLLDFNIVYNDYEMQVPSYEINLELKKRNKNNRFDTEKISEEEFYN